MGKLHKVEECIEKAGVMPIVEQTVAGAVASRSWSKEDTVSLGLRVAHSIIDYISDHVRNQPQGEGK